MIREEIIPWRQNKIVYLLYVVLMANIKCRKLVNLRTRKIQNIMKIHKNDDNK